MGRLFVVLYIQHAVFTMTAPYLSYTTEPPQVVELTAYCDGEGLGAE